MRWNVIILTDHGVSKSCELLYKVSPFKSVSGASRSDVFNENIYFLTSLLHAKAFFLYQFEK